MDTSTLVADFLEVLSSMAPLLVAAVVVSFGISAVGFVVGLFRRA